VGAFRPIGEEEQMATAMDALQDLDFGFVDSESEEDLDRKFLKTEEFDRFFNESVVMVLGAKGSGKSAIFKYLTRYEPLVREVQGERIEKQIFVSGTGFKDLKELSTEDIEAMMREPGFNFERLWKIYIAIKIAIKLGQEGYSSYGILRDFLIESNRVTDYRILPLLRKIWTFAIGDPVSLVEVDIAGNKVKIGGSGRTIDVLDILTEVNDLLGREDRKVVVLFDKIDEILSNDPESRREALEGLFRAYLSMNAAFPNIRFKIFIRTDLWGALQFTNKSHLSDKILRLNWSAQDLTRLLIKRAYAHADVKEFLDSRIPAFKTLEVDDAPQDAQLRAFYSLFAPKVYKGEREADLLDWMIARCTDALEGIYPRELIQFGNISAENQRKTAKVGPDYLIEGASVLDAYYEVSKNRCDTYLTEFPKFIEHFKRFAGRSTPTFSRDDLYQIMEGLQPDGEDMLKGLYELGLLIPRGGNVSTATAFEIPRLYRAGLGLVIPGRP
jgi:hypothetical protein